MDTGPQEDLDGALHGLLSRMGDWDLVPLLVEQTDEEVEMVTYPFMATVEIARRVEVVSDGMQVARLLARFLRNAFRKEGLSAHADRLVRNLRADQREMAALSQKQVEEAAR